VEKDRVQLGERRAKCVGSAGGNEEFVLEDKQGEFGDCLFSRKPLLRKGIQSKSHEVMEGMCFTVPGGRGNHNKAPSQPKGELT